MKIIAIGANGIIGKAVVTSLKNNNHQVISVGHTQGDIRVDITNPSSIEAMFEQVGSVDGIICMAGDGEMGAFNQMPIRGYESVLQGKVLGQIQIARIGLNYLNEGGSITLTSGQAADNPNAGTAAIAVGVAGINAFVKVASLELDSNQRINAVSPAIVKETLQKWGADDSFGIPAAEVANHYLASIEGTENGQIFNATP